jgi:myo-inositol catabolism protein IolC
MISDEHFFEALGRLLDGIDQKQVRPKYLEPLYRMFELWPDQWPNLPPLKQRLWLQSLDMFLHGQPHAVGDVYLSLEQPSKHLADSFLQAFNFLRMQRGI